MPGQHAGDAFAEVDHAGGAQLAHAGERGRRRRLAADAHPVDVALGLHELLIGHLFDDAIRGSDRSDRLVVAHRIADSNRRGHRLRRQAMPLFEVLSKAAIERVGSAGLNGGEPRHPGDPACIARFDQRLAERAGVAEVAGGDDDPVGRVPLEILQQFPDDGLLPFDAERVDGVDEVHLQPLRCLEHQAHGGVEIAADLEAKRAIGEGLGQFSSGDSPRGDEYDGAESSLSGVCSERRAGVAGRRAGDGARSESNGLCHGYGHAPILERACRILTFVFEKDAVAFVQTSGSFRMRDDSGLVDRENGFAKSPDSALIDGAATAAALIKNASLESHPIAFHVEQAAAIARVTRFRSIELTPAEHAGEPFAHTGCAPRRAIAATRA